jgi:hypothetical protein
MSRDPRVEHLQRLHRQRRLRAAGHFSRMGAPGYGDVPQRSQPRDAGRMLFALVLMTIILGVLLAIPSHGDVRAWVHQLSHSCGWIASGYYRHQMAGDCHLDSLWRPPPGRGGVTSRFVLQSAYSTPSLMPKFVVRYSSGKRLRIASAQLA